MRFFTLFAPFLLASTSLAAPVEPREAADNVPTITTRRLTNYHPLSFSFNKHVSRLAFQPSNDNIVGCQEEHVRSFFSTLLFCAGSILMVRNSITDLHTCFFRTLYQTPLSSSP